MCDRLVMRENSALGQALRLFLQVIVFPSSTSSSTYVDSFVTEGGTTNINSTSSGYATDGYSDQFSGTESVSSFAEGSFTFTSTIVGGNCWFCPMGRLE